MSESTSSESSSILSSPRVRKQKRFGDDFYVYEKRKRRNRSNKPCCDESMENGGSKFAPISKPFPKCAPNLKSNVLRSTLLNDYISSQNGHTDPESGIDEPKNTLYQNGFHKHSTSQSVNTRHDAGVKESDGIQTFSFSTASDIGDYFKKEAMQLSNESNESSRQSELEVKEFGNKHFELPNRDVTVKNSAEPGLKESDQVEIGESNTIESAEPYLKETGGERIEDFEDMCSFQSKFENCEAPVSACDSLFLNDSTIPDHEAEIKDVQFPKEFLSNSYDVEKPMELAISETNTIACDVKLETCSVSSDSVTPKTKRSRKKANNAVIISDKKISQKDISNEKKEIECIDLENDPPEMVEGTSNKVDKKYISDKATPSDLDIKLSSDSIKGTKSTGTFSVNEKPETPSYPLKRRGRKPKSLTDSKPKPITDLESLPESNVNSPSLDSDKDNMTSTSTSEVCFSCKVKNHEVVKCSVESCQKYYHSECLTNLPTSKSETKACSLHTCLTCHNSNPRLSQNSKGEMYKCFKCPTAFHKSDACSIPGAAVLTGDVMSCPDHFKPEKLRQYQPVINLPFCVVCGMNMDLSFCNSCPHASHSTCQPMEMIEKGKNKCFRCVKRKILQFGDVVWAKVYDFRWWPAKILRVSEVDDETKKCLHYDGEFPIKFFGTGEIYWIQKSRVYPFVYKHVDRESLGVQHNFRKVAPSPSFEQALNEALKVTNNLIVSLPSKFGSESKKYPPYKHIKSNRPIGSVQIYAADEFDNNPCNCRADDRDPCGYDAVCLNRSMCTECAPGMCNAGDRCQNQKFQKREYAPAKPYWTSVRGWGLQATADIKDGHFVSEYCGDLIDEEECQRRIKEKQAVGDNNFYFCTLDANRIIDAGPKGNFSRFMNHSCDPNCVTQKWIVNGDARVGIFAKYDIPGGSELTFDYQMDFSHFKKLKCNCGAKKCSGIIGKKPQSGSRQKGDGPGSDVEASEDSNDSKETVLKKQKGPKLKTGNLTPKTEVAEVKKKAPAGKNVIKKSENALNPKISQKSDKVTCFKCKTGGKLVHCSFKDCGKAYHVRCVKSSLGDKDSPSESWDCPRHFCAKCKDKATYMCCECPKSFCDTHVTKKNKNKEKYLCPKHA